MTQAVVDQVAQLLRAPVEELLSGDVASLSGAETIELVRLAEQHRNQLAAVDAWLLTALGEKALTGEIGTTSTADVLVTECRVSPGAARARVKAARDLGPRRSLVGEVLEPIFPRVAAALVSGSISDAHARVIRTAIMAIPAEKAVYASAASEEFLVKAARQENPRALQQTADLLLAHLNPDGKKPDERRSQDRRDWSMFASPDGGYDGTFHLTAETAATWLAILDALAAPRTTTDENGTVIERDERTAGQRRHDALLEAGQRLLNSGTLPATGGTPTTILVRVKLSDFPGDTGFGAVTRTPEHDTVSDILSAASGGAHPHSGVAPQRGVAQTQHGGLMSVQKLMHLSCEANIIPVVLDDLGGVMAFGRGQRLASPGQRYALTVRDGGCCFPACDRPAAWSEVHHIEEWVDGGRTDIDNLCLLCAHHHRSFEREGWIVEMIGGRPQWIPPAWLDPQRKPRHNTAHHLDDIIFAVPETPSPSEP